jgi:Icc-related predicted phosphoesterase
MRLVLGSDLHGYLPEVLPCDVLVLAGDIMPDYEQSRFYLGRLRQWLNNAPVRHIVATWGNHDWPYNVQGLPDLRWHMLVDRAITLEGVTFYGSPWSLPYYSWAWQAPEETLDKLYSFIPDNTDVLISHQPPFGMCDKNDKDMHEGSKSLYDRMAELSQLKLVVCGHIHEARGQSGIVVNASCVTRHMQLRRNPWVVIDI